MKNTKTIIFLLAVVVACGLLASFSERGHFDVMHHVMNGPQMEYPLVPWAGHFTVPFNATKVTAWLFIAATVLVSVFAVARRGGGLVPRGLYNLLEMLVVFVRDELAIKNIGKKHGRAYTPYLLTVFFFILTSNLLGLIPGGVTVTANINVTATLAVMTLLVMQVGGIMEYGFAHHLKNLLPGGLPGWLKGPMFLIELMGLVAKPFALAVRLFANMTAGHVIILSLLSLIFSLGAVFAPISVVFALGIYVLELLVAFLQAYIFTMLTALFIGMSVHVSH